MDFPLVKFCCVASAPSSPSCALACSWSSTSSVRRPLEKHCKKQHQRANKNLHLEADYRQFAGLKWNQSDRSIKKKKKHKGGIMGEMFASRSGFGERNRVSGACGVLSSEPVLLQVTNDFHQAADTGWCSAVILLARSAGFNPRCSALIGCFRKLLWGRLRCKYRPQCTCYIRLPWEAVRVRFNSTWSTADNC